MNISHYDYSHSDMDLLATWSSQGMALAAMDTAWATSMGVISTA